MVPLGYDHMILQDPPGNSGKNVTIFSLEFPILLEFPSQVTRVYIQHWLALEVTTTEGLHSLQLNAGPSKNGGFQAMNLKIFRGVPIFRCKVLIFGDVSEKTSPLKAMMVGRLDPAFLSKLASF